ncbi:hypothetical protein EUGRSUZ_G02079 [Eucalyptus grandis]|uniref:Protein POLLEN DEFECTIVE IN GUIDANCE 1 n=2 Tax=Eucalyptus grandis TaxID=71139 RepID=A0A059BFN3_EUCGR|nr:hypothetical protein EUGRSUZ_G02079 [Eucalyptus grandis]
MDLRSRGRRLSFEILSRSDDLLLREESEGESPSPVLRSDSDPVPLDSPRDKSARRKRKHRRKRQASCSVIPEDGGSCRPNGSGSLPEVVERGAGGVFCEDGSSVSRDGGVDSRGRANGVEFDCKSYSVGSLGSVTQVVNAESQGSVFGDECRRGELRQRAVNGGEDRTAEGEQSSREESGIEASSVLKGRSEPNGSVPRKLENAESLDWKKVVAEDSFVQKSPMRYFLDEMSNGNALRNTTTLGNDKERERIYDTIFRLPWRCELLIDVGVLVCFDSFLSLLTIMPTRIAILLWRLLSTRRLKRLSAEEFSDLGCFIVLTAGVNLLERTDISLIYHMIRGQGTIKLYVVYNVLEIFDKLCQNFGGDVLKTLFNSAEELAGCSPEKMILYRTRFLSDLVLAVGASIVHSFILLAQAITLSTCIVAHNNALLALLVSNNFAEIKSNVFKRFSRDNIHSLVYFDSVERFHITAFVLFVLAQNILEAEGPWFESFFINALMVYFCEISIDIIKHSFIAKFNDIKPIAYSEFLEDLCKQTLNIQTDLKNSLTFVPLAPACVVIRVLTPVYAALIPCHPLPWRVLWILLLLAVTYIMLVSLKVMVRLGLQKHAAWYVSRCQKRRHHLHLD